VAQIGAAVDVQLTEEQLQLRRSARDVLARECPMRLVRAALEDRRAASAELEKLWRRMAELGWLGLVLPEAQGGAGAELLDLAVLCEEAGRALLPAPLLSHTLGGLAVARAGDAAQRSRWLPAVASGTLRLAPILGGPEGTGDAPGTAFRARPSGSQLQLDGVARFVPDADAADWLVVAVRQEGGAAPHATGLVLVDARAPGVTVRPIAFVDATRSFCEVSLDGVRVGEQARLGSPQPGGALLEELRDWARVALAAECCGGAEKVLEASVAYARTREQFGRPIGSFQAIQHKCADMLVLVESARSAVWNAAWAVGATRPDERRQAHAAACMAKAYCSEAYARVAGHGIQIHGGLGFTWEQDPHLYYKRAKADEPLYGDPASCREEVARTLLDS
jgi:alkylation response protein AidB-like acyl-CoA dehydrogenase